MFSESYITVEGKGATHVCISLYRERCNNETRYRVHVYPCTIDFTNKVMCVKTILFSGYTATVNVCKRASKSAEEIALENARSVSRELYDLICSENNLKRVGVFGLPSGFKVL